jgi:hypothetical protein
MKSISGYHRQYVWPGRRQRIYQYMQQFASKVAYSAVLREGVHRPIDDARFNSYLDEYPITLPGFAILSPEDAIVTASHQSIDLVLEPFKLRQIDPLVETPDGFKRLSKLDPSFATRLGEHKAHHEQTRIARLSVPDPKTHALLRDTIEYIDEVWQQRLASSRRMAPKELRNLVGVAATQIHGPYPFASFLEY